MDALYHKISKKGECFKTNLLEINDKEKVFVQKCDEHDTIILCGGDGTLDQFVNRIRGEKLRCKLYFYSCGSGNDFVREYKKKILDITYLLLDFPKVRINKEEEYVFANGVGMGIDAVVCRSKQQYKFSEIKKSYFSIALSSLKGFRPYSLDVWIDDVLHHYDDVWFFICNHGKYMGGGMKVTPNAIRNDEYLDLCIVHSIPLWKVILIFPLIFLGKHVAFKKHIVSVHCRKLRAVPEGCNLLQRDGEILDYVREIEVER